jgi:hypothetical protein
MFLASADISSHFHFDTADRKPFKGARFTPESNRVGLKLA